VAMVRRSLQPGAARRRRRIRWQGVVTHVLTWGFGLFLLLPIYQMAVTALKAEPEIWYSPPTLYAREPTLSNFVTMLQIVPRLPVHLLNSFVYGLGVSLLSLLIALPAAYGLSRFRVPGEAAIVFGLTYANMFAPIMLVVPLYSIMRRLGLLDTHLAMVVAGSIFTLPLSTLLLSTYFRTVPREIDEAALVDGCSRPGALVRVVLPLVAPAVVAVGIYAFITGWSQQFVLSLVLIQSPDLMPITQGLYQFFSRSSVRWPELMAASTVAAAIPVALFVAVQRYIVQGLTAAAIKG